MKQRSLVLIDKSALLHNATLLKNRLNGAQMWPVVKQDAYGHGAIDCARVLAPMSDRFVVASIQEGIALREAGITQPVIVLEPLLPGMIGLYKKFALIAVLSSVDQIDLLDKDLIFHIEVNTGMNRLGVPVEQIPALMQRLSAVKLKPEGIFTHFYASLDKRPQETREQYSRFRSVFHHFESDVIRHAGNSEAVMQFGESHFDAGRPGVALYGAGPFTGLKPVMQWVTYVSQTRTVDAGEGVSYNWSWQAAQRTHVATIPVGYADGYPRNASNKALVCVADKWFPGIGTVTMDYLFADTGSLAATTGQQVWLLRPPFTVNELAEAIGTIPYELMCTIGSRNQRRMVESVRYDRNYFDIESEGLVVPESIVSGNN